MAAGSTIGTIFKVTTWENPREGHRRCCRRLPGGSSTGRIRYPEALRPQKTWPGAVLRPREKRAMRSRSLSGVFEGKTTGTPISMIVRNTDQRSRDYSNIVSCFRPGHADYTFEEKYGFRDYRGGGRSSAGRPSAASQQVPSQRSS